MSARTTPVGRGLPPRRRAASASACELGGRRRARSGTRSTERPLWSQVFGKPALRRGPWTAHCWTRSSERPLWSEVLRAPALGRNPGARFPREPALGRGPQIAGCGAKSSDSPIWDAVTGEPVLGRGRPSARRRLPAPTTPSRLRTPPRPAPTRPRSTASSSQGPRASVNPPC